MERKYLDLILLFKPTLLVCLLLFGTAITSYHTPQAIQGNHKEASRTHLEVGIEAVEPRSAVGERDAWGRLLGQGGIDCYQQKECSRPYYSLNPTESYDQGVCFRGKCECTDGWSGTYCEQPAPKAFFSCNEEFGTSCEEKLNIDKEVYGGNLTVTIVKASNRANDV